MFYSKMVLLYMGIVCLESIEVQDRGQKCLEMANNSSFAFLRCEPLSEMDLIEVRIWLITSLEKVPIYIKHVLQ